MCCTGDFGGGGDQSANGVVGVGSEGVCSPGLMSMESRERRVGDEVVSRQEERQGTMPGSWVMMMTWPVNGCRTRAGECASRTYNTREPAGVDVQRHRKTGS